MSVVRPSPEQLDEWNEEREIIVRFDYKEEPSSYHSFHSEKWARKAIKYHMDEWNGEAALLMIPGKEHELITP